MNTLMERLKDRLLADEGVIWSELQNPEGPVLNAHIYFDDSNLRSISVDFHLTGSVVLTMFFAYGYTGTKYSLSIDEGKWLYNEVAEVARAKYRQALQDKLLTVLAT